MPTTNELMLALRNADAAGDTEAARRIAAMVQAQKIKEGQQQQLQSLAEKQGPMDALAIGMGKGLYDIGRGVGLVDKPDAIEKQAYSALEESRPISTGAGEVIGQILPFVTPATAAGGLSTMPARVAASAGVGALEGGIIANSQDGDVLKSGGFSGALAGSMELLFPYIGRAASKIYRYVRGRDPDMGLLMKDGTPTPELKKVMAEEGITIDDVVTAGMREAGEDPAFLARKKLFDDAGVNPTRGELTQKLEDQKPEQFLMEQTTDPSGDVLRSFVKDRNEQLRNYVDSTIDTLGVPDDVGETVKATLEGNKATLKANRKRAYNALSEATENLTEGMPLMTDRFLDALPDGGDIRDVAAMMPNEYKAVAGLLGEFGIETSDELVESLTKQGVDITPLNINNFERFRKRLGAIESRDQTGTISRITGPIRNALDEEVETATEQLVRSGNPDIAELAKEARRSHIALKKDFDPASMAEILIKKKGRFSDIPSVEESQVYSKLSARSTPVEQVQRVVDILNGKVKSTSKEVVPYKEGSAKSINAIGDLQASVLMDLIDSGFQASSRKIDGARQFGGAAFQKRYSQLSDKIDVIFKDSPEALKKVKNLNKLAELMTPPSGATPKGSAGFLMEAMNKSGLFSIMERSPAGAITSEAIRKVGSLSKNRKALNNAFNTKPKVKEMVKMINRDMPAVGVMLGISYLNDAEEER